MHPINFSVQHKTENWGPQNLYQKIHGPNCLGPCKHRAPTLELPKLLGFFVNSPRPLGCLVVLLEHQLQWRRWSKGPHIISMSRSGPEFFFWKNPWNWHGKNTILPPGKHRWAQRNMCWLIMAPYFSPPFGSGAAPCTFTTVYILSLDLGGFFEDFVKPSSFYPDVCKDDPDWL